jgi:hypothetical protein
VPIAEQDQRRVPVAVAAAVGRADEIVNLALRQVLAGAERSVGWSLRLAGARVGAQANSQKFGFRM